MAGQTPNSIKMVYIPNRDQHHKAAPPPARCHRLYTAAIPPHSQIRLQKCQSVSLPPRNRALPPDHAPPIHSAMLSHSTRSLPSLPPHKRSLPSTIHPHPHHHDPYAQKHCNYSLKPRCHTHIHGRSKTELTAHRHHNIRCICGRRMQYTQNPQNKYPPNAVLYCQQWTRCKKQMMIQCDWFFYCKSRTSYHGTKDGKFKICYACSMNVNAKQDRIRKNHQLLIKQLKSKDHGHVFITSDTKEYILSSTSSNSKDPTLRLLKQTYITPSADAVGDKVAPVVMKEGFMMKKGNVWNKAFKKRYFKLFENKLLFYYKTYENGMASDERGVADLNVIDEMRKKGKNGLEISTPAREWKFLCNSCMERDEWWDVIRTLAL